jgi:N-acetylmuramoyl-L-alanine amidase
MAQLITNQLLSPSEYNAVAFPKDKIVIHHTAGSHNPLNTIYGWNTDRNKYGLRRLVGTAFVIGGKSTRTGDTTFDGKIYRCFDEKFWAVHLGGEELYHLDKSSIAIEICNYGPLSRSRNGKFINYVNSEVPADQVVKLDQPFRGFLYYHRYTDAQMAALKQLLQMLATEFRIDLKKGLQEWIKKETLKLPPNLTLKDKQRWLRQHGFTGLDGELIVADGIKGPNTEWALAAVGKSSFEFNYEALNGKPGLWTHTNVRLDKFDCSPQVHLKEMLLGL